jgi:ribosomal-protein-alanine N-acetyltransferase
MILQTHRLILEPILESELTTLYEILTDSYVRRYLCDDKILPLQQVEEMIVQSKKSFEEEGVGLWFIQLKDIKEVSGFIGLWYFFDEEQPQLIYALLPKSTKKGYATEATIRLLDYCFIELNYEYLLTSCDRLNVESQKLAKRLGMKEIEEKIVNENPILFFKIEKSHWERRNKN